MKYTIFIDEFTGEFGLMNNSKPGFINFYDQNNKIYDKAFYSEYSKFRFTEVIETPSVKEFLQFKKEQEEIKNG